MYLLISVSAAKRTKAGRFGLYLGPQSIQCVGNIGKIFIGQILFHFSFTPRAPERAKGS